jgi:glycosyltransferase involved in cell wall biosynthesis
MVKNVSIIIPLYNEAGNIEELVAEIIKAMLFQNYGYEIILVNDGSIDNSWQIISTLSAKVPFIKGIDLAGNYGQTIALRAGIELAAGDVIVAMDGDLQHDPKYIPTFISYMEKGYEMVGGAKQKRPDGFFKSLLGNMAHRFICMMSGVKMKYFGATFKAYRSYLLKNTNLLGDTHRFLGAIVARRGIKYIEIPIEIRSRVNGKSNYNISKMFLVIIDLLFLKFTISHMNKPFRFFGFRGAILFLIGFIPAVWIVISSLFFHVSIKEQYIAEFLFSIFLMLAGFLIISIGLIAEIGIFNYYARGNKPYIVRQETSTVFMYDTVSHN